MCTHATVYLQLLSVKAMLNVVRKSWRKEKATNKHLKLTKEIADLLFFRESHDF